MPITEERVRAVLADSPLLAAADYAALTAAANADPDEGAEWLPYYKLALAVLGHAFGMVEAVAGLNTPPGSPADARRMAVIRRARDLFRLHLRPCGLGPDATAAGAARVDALIAGQCDALAVTLTPPPLLFADSGGRS